MVDRPILTLLMTYPTDQSAHRDAEKAAVQHYFNTQIASKIKPVVWAKTPFETSEEYTQ
jgi:hypothetical protein